MGQVFDEKWSTALKSLYGSVVNEDRYVDFLDQVQNLINSRFLVLGMFDPHDPQRHVHRFSAPRSIGPAGAAEYLALAAQTHEEGMHKMLGAGPQNVVLDIDVYKDRESLAEVPTMKLLREKYGATHIGSVNAQAHNAWVDYVMFAHEDKQYKHPDSIRAGVEYFVPHIGVASEIRRAFKLLEDRYKAVFSALSYLKYGVALVLDNREILLANAAFDAIIDQGDGLRKTLDNRIAANGDTENAIFQQALSDTVSAAKGRETNYRKTIALKRSAGEAPYILDLAPFCDDVAGELNLSIEGALLFIVNPEHSALLSHNGLSAAFSLTPTESEVCRHVLDGHSNSEIAERQDVALPTVKSQVSSIFAKTRVTDRAGLIRLASKVTPPLVEPG